MRRVYTPTPRRNDLPFVFLGAAALTLAVFLVLPLTQMVSARRDAVMTLRPAEVSALEPEAESDLPPPPPSEDTPPEEPPPSLADAAPPLNLSVNLDVAFGSGGAMAAAAGLFDQAASAAGGLDAFSVADLERRPELLGAVPPTYPDALRKARVEGSVTLVFVLDESGRVTDPRVESSTHAEFEAPALEAIRKWKYKPGIKDGQPVPAFLRQPIRFRLPASS